MGQAYALPVVSPNADVQPYAGFWLRFAAYLIDSIVLFVIQMVLAAAVILMDPGDLRAFLNVAPVGWALTWAYFAVLESSPLQGTVGKHALGLYVADVYGDPIGLGRASARYWLKLLSSLLLMAGWVMAAFTHRKQALHDMVARTLVLRRLPPAMPRSAAEAANLEEYWDGRRWVSTAPLEAQP
ncbi:MAG: RDD family protein [Chloroflexi bacterium]|nr:MAG: RDD family protein [Chloroflexota bacterium]